MSNHCVTRLVTLSVSLFVLNSVLPVLAEEPQTNTSKKHLVNAEWQSKVVEPMQAAEIFLQHTEEANSASSAQAEAITGLNAMIAELTQRKSQCQGSQCSSGECKKPAASKPGAGKAGKTPAKSASPSTNNDADLSTELADAGELVKDLWGKLPERQREQILQPLREEFLPKYADDIEAYFRALADPSRNPSISQ